MQRQRIAMRPWWGALALAVALALPGFVAAQDRQDEIHMKDGTVISKVEIMKETCDEVTYKFGGSRQSQPADKVATIRYADRPGRYSRATSYFTTGKYDQAVAELDQMIAAPGDSTWLVQYCLHMKGQAQLEQARTDPGKYEDAVDTFQKFVDEKDWADHRLAPEMLRGLGDALVGAGNLDGAGKVFDDLSALKCPGPWEMNGKYGKGLILIKQSKYQEARSLLEDVVQKSSGKAGSEDLHGLALCGLGEAWLAEDSFSNAIEQYQKVVKAAEAEFARTGALYPILARAYNGLGDAYRLKAEKRSDKKDYREAAIAYLHVVVLFVGPSSERSHALEHGAAACEQVGWADMARSLSEEKQAR